MPNLPTCSRMLRGRARSNRDHRDRVGRSVRTDTKSSIFHISISLPSAHTACSETSFSLLWPCCNLGMARELEKVPLVTVRQKQRRQQSPSDRKVTRKLTVTAARLNVPIRHVRLMNWSSLAVHRCFNRGSHCRLLRRRRPLSAKRLFILLTAKWAPKWWISTGGRCRLNIRPQAGSSPSTWRCALLSAFLM